MFVVAEVTVIATPIGIKLLGIPIDDSLKAVPDAAIVILAVYVERVMSLTNAPVVAFSVIDLNPFLERTAPEKVVLAM